MNINNIKRIKMKLKVITGMVLTLFLASMLTLVFNIQQVKASGTIYIKADGSVDPPTAPISSVDNVTYTLTGNVNDFIVVERDNIVVDGAGYTVQGTGAPESKGISLSGRSNVTIKNMKIEAFRTGIELSGRSNVTIKNMEIKGFHAGIWLTKSSNNTISGNTVTNGWCGIYLDGSSNNIISGNNITKNGYGIALCSSSNNVLRGNSMADNMYNFRVSGQSLSEYVHNVDASNRVDGKPVYYWINMRDVAVPVDAGYVALINCTGITVQNLTLTNNWQGTLLAYTTNSTITKNNITKNAYGIWLVQSSNRNIISGNNITANGGDGIRLEWSSNNSIYENNITKNGHGIWLSSSSNNNVCGNQITNHSKGIVLSRSSNNSIYGNNITSNYDGIYLEWSLNNKFYHNNFIDNTVYFWKYGYGYANVWDDGYPSGGNYWSYYTGADANGDGIGDRPYVIDSNNTDRYPLMAPYETPETTPPTILILSPENKTYRVNDVPVTFTVSELASWIGYSLDGQMNVTIAGNTTLSGLSDGSHSLILYANDTAGNTGASEIIYFTIKTQQAKPFPTWIVAAIVIIAAVGAALLVYFTKVKKTTEKVK